MPIGLDDAIIIGRLFMAAKRWNEKRKIRKQLKEDVMGEQFASVIRTVIKSAGGGLVGAGIVTSGELEILAGAVAVVIGLAWSWWVKRDAAKV